MSQSDNFAELMSATCPKCKDHGYVKVGVGYGYICTCNQYDARMRVKGVTAWTTTVSAATLTKVTK